MLQKIEELKNKAIQEINIANNEEILRTIELEYFGRKAGKIGEILKAIPSLNPSERGIIGKTANEAKKEVEQKIIKRNFKTIVSH